MTLDDLLNGTSPAVRSISVSPVASPPSLVVVFPIGERQQELRIFVLENGEIDIDVEERLKGRACGLIENLGIGVGIEFLRKELSL